MSGEHVDCARTYLVADAQRLGIVPAIVLGYLRKETAIAAVSGEASSDGFYWIRMPISGPHKPLIEFHERRIYRALQVLEAKRLIAVCRCRTGSNKGHQYRVIREVI